MPSPVRTVQCILVRSEGGGPGEHSAGFIHEAQGVKQASRLEVVERVSPLVAALAERPVHVGCAIEPPVGFVELREGRRRGRREVGDLVIRKELDDLLEKTSGFASGLPASSDASPISSRSRQSVPAFLPSSSDVWSTSSASSPWPSFRRNAPMARYGR